MAINNFVSTVWSETLLRSLDRKYVGIANCNREFEGDIREKGNIVKICGLNAVTVGNYAKNTDLKAPQALDDFSVDLEINQAKYFNFQVDDVDRAQSVPGMMELALEKAANALANVAETYVYNLMEQASNLITLQSATPENVLDTLIDARTILLRLGVSDPADIVIEVPPDVAGLILKAKANLCTDNTDALENGYIGSIGGCKIYVSHNLPANNVNGTEMVWCIARTRRAVAFAEQLSEVEAYRPENRFADAMKGLHLYGAKIVYPEEIVKIEMGVQMV